VQDPPPPLSQFLQDCPDELEGVLERALVKNREERYATPEDFAWDLARVHQQCVRKMLGETLQQAADALHRKDFVTARQQVLQVLRGAPQNAEASELLRQIKQAQEQQQHEQQVLQLQMKAEEAFRRNRLDEALQFTEHGMRLDPEGSVFPGLRDAIIEAQSKLGRYRETLKRAESALRGGDLEGAKTAVEEAQAILPDDPGARTLASQIIARLEHQLREQQAAEKQRQFALQVNAVEKAMADVRMMLLLGQVPEAQLAVEKMERDIAQLPPQWTEQFRALKKEVREKREEPNRTATQEYTLDGRTAEIPSGFSATVVTQQRPVDAGPSARGEAPAAPHLDVPPAPVADTGRFATSETAHGVLYPRGESARDSEKTEIAPELREFLEPVPSVWTRPTMWLGVAVVVLIGVFVWLALRPSSESRSGPKTNAVANSSYAEINAEPWATVTGVTPVSGEAQSAVGQVTPLRVMLPPGQYQVTLQGPNHEVKRVDVTVPAQGEVACFAVFKKPDLNRIVGKE